jgi:hypothetical protein
MQSYLVNVLSIIDIIMCLSVVLNSFPSMLKYVLSVRLSVCLREYRRECRRELVLD